MWGTEFRVAAWVPRVCVQGDWGEGRSLGVTQNHGIGWKAVWVGMGLLRVCVCRMWDRHVWGYEVWLLSVECFVFVCLSGMCILFVCQEYDMCSLCGRYVWVVWFVCEESGICMTCV